MAVLYYLGSKYRTRNDQAPKLKKTNWVTNSSRFIFILRANISRLPFFGNDDIESLPS